MAFYNEYSANVPYGVLGAWTNSSVSNVIADFYVSAGATLVKHATEGTASAATNYAEVTWKGFYIRFYGNTNSHGAINTIVAATSGGSQLFTVSTSYYNTGSIVSVKMRFYNLKSGIYAWFYNTSGTWTACLFSGTISRVSNGATSYFMNSGSISFLATCYVVDDTSTTFGLGNTAVYDAEATKQMLLPAFIYAGSASSSIKYIIQDIFASSSFIYSGIVQMGSRYFYMPSSAGYALELNS